MATATKEQTAAVIDVTPENAALEKAKPVDIPSVITEPDVYARVYVDLKKRYHVLTPFASFSGLAPQHGLIVAKVLIDSDPDHGEVYQDKLFCKTKDDRGQVLHEDQQEVALTKVGLRKLALAGGMNLTSDIIDTSKRHRWVLRGNNRFVGLDGAVQTFSAIEEYDLADGSPQIRGWTEKQKEAARAHGMRGADARAMNAACREFGIKQKYTRAELKKPFAIMRVMFIPDATNEVQMRIITERALQGAIPQMYPQAAIPLEGIDGMAAPPLETIEGVAVPPAAKAAEQATKAADAKAQEASGPRIPVGFVLIKSIEVKQIQRRPKGNQTKEEAGTFPKFVVIDSNGEEHVTIKKAYSESLYKLWNKDDWTKGRPVQIESRQNAYQENEIDEIEPYPESGEEPPLPMGD